MPKFVVEGGHPLRGTIRPAGNKNAALPIIAACLLTDEEMALEPMGWLRFPDPFSPWDEQVAA